MSAYEQRAREWLIADGQGMHFGAEYERRVRSLTALLATVATEAHAKAVEIIRQTLAECAEEDYVAWDTLESILIERIRSLQPNPSLVVVARADLDVLTEAAAELEQRIRAERAGYDVSRADEIRTAIDRLRAGEE